MRRSLARRTQIRNNVLLRHSLTTFASWLKANYDNWLKLNDERTLKTLLSGGADDTLLSGSIVQVDGEWWIDGYASAGLSTLDPNAKTIIQIFIPDSIDVLGSGVYYSYHIRMSGSYYIYNRLYSSGVWRVGYVANAVTEPIDSTLISNKRMVLVVTIAESPNNMVSYGNGLLVGEVALANDFTETTIDSSNSGIGALNDSGSNAWNGYVGELQITNQVLSYRDVREISLRAMGYTNPLGFHDVYGILGDTTAYLTFGTAISNDLESGMALRFVLTINTYAANDRIVSIGNLFYIAMTANSGDGVKLTIFRDFSTTDGTWVMDDYLLTLGERHHVYMHLDDSDVGNDPTLEIDNVAAALTESSTPVGTASDMLATALTLLGNAGANNADALLEQFTAWSSALSAAQRSQAYNGGSPTDESSIGSPLVAIQCGDFIDTINIDYILTTSTGTIYDASGNENDATPTNMDHNNLIETRPTRYQTTLANLNPYFDYMFYGYGSKFRRYGTTNDYGTNTVADGEDWQGYREVALDGSTSYVDLVSVINGSMPSQLAFVCRVKFDNWADGIQQTITFINKADSSDYFYIEKRTTNVIRIEISIDTVKYQIDTDVSSFVGFHTIGFSASATQLIAIIDDVVSSPVVLSGSIDGTITQAMLGALSTTPSRALNGNISFAGYKISALTSSQLLAVHNQLARVPD